MKHASKDMNFLFPWCFLIVKIPLLYQIGSNTTGRIYY